MMLKVGVTGGIGSGKSTICQIFQCLQIPVFNADEAGRRLLAENAEVIEQVKILFGEDIAPGGKPDRKKIAASVFTSPEKLSRLNSIIHPAVRKEFNRWAAAQTSSYIIDEAAILIETGIYKQLDFTILVVAPEALRTARVMQRDHINETDIKARMKNQWSDEDKQKVAAFVIVNDDVQPLLPQVMSIHSAILTKAL